MVLICVADVSPLLGAESLLGRTGVFLGTNSPLLGAKMLLGTDRTVLGIYLFPGTREGPTAALGFDLDSGCHRDHRCLSINHAGSPPPPQAFIGFKDLQS